VRLLGGSGGALRGSARKWWSPRPREHWKPDGQLLGWKWRERVGHGAEIMGGVRFVRNSVHHQWQTRSELTALAGRRTKIPCETHGFVRLTSFGGERKSDRECRNGEDAGACVRTRELELSVTDYSKLVRRRLFTVVMISCSVS
jgi:hypothetical protein